MLSFRQPGDMGRYVADNDPGGIAAGFSNLEDFLAAGNKIPDYVTGREPLQGVSQDIFGAPNILTSLNPKSGAQQATPGTPNTESFFQVTPPSIPVSEQTPMSGLRDSDGNPLPNFTPIRSPGLPPSDNFLDDTNPLQTMQGPQDTLNPPLLDTTKSLPVTVSGPQGIMSTATAPETNQFQGFDDRLTKIEEGIASLLQNRGQQSNFGMQPRFDFGMQPRFNMSGLGYFFNPQGGFYG